MINENLFTLDEIKEELAIIASSGFKHIVEKLLEFYTQEDYVRNYLHSIIFDGRGNRKGFPAPVMTALFKIYFKLPENRLDIWEEKE